MFPMNRQFCRIVVALTVLLAAAGCSTTRRLADGEVLYTGVKKIEITPDSGVKVPKTVISDVKKPLSVAPNNPLISPYVRTPLPIGLWAYNYLYTPKKTGLKHWLYNRLAKDPVLISKVRPDLRLEVARTVLDNNGYFGSAGDYELLYSKHNPKKARVSYRLTVPPPFRYDSVLYLTATGPMGRLIDSLGRTTSLRVGAQYNLDTLAAERVRITNVLRNRGYYYFRPEFIEYLADTTLRPKWVDLHMQLRKGIPPAALKTYRVGNIRVVLMNSRPGPWDSMRYKGLDVIYQRPLKLRPRILADLVDLSTGETYTVNEQNSTQTRFSKLGVFRSVSLNVPPLDSLKGADSLDVQINAAFDLPLEGSLEVDLTSKSNSFLGPGVIFSLRDINAFRGGEVFAVRIKGSYEWQTGNSRQLETKSSLLNSYELGINASLGFPRLYAPWFYKKMTEYPSRTVFELNADLMNRPKYFHMVSFGGSAGYDFQTSPYSYHNLTVLKLVYNKLLHTTSSFDRTMEENPAIAESFKNQFIPSLTYTYTYDRPYGSRGDSRLFWQTSATSAGNLLWSVLEAFGKTGKKRIFGNPFSQFVKGTTEVRWYRRVGLDNWLVSRLLVGAGHAYGNSRVMPYSEQFYIGGANSIRAFTIRSLGPGSYRPSKDQVDGYFDQTGDFKLEANVEFRFGIAGRLHGAVFVDAGNIWLLEKDPLRPGGELRMKTFWKDIALGTGFGLRYDISYIVIRADLGIGIHTPYPNPHKRGYYNISSFKDGLGFHLAIGYPF